MIDIEATGNMRAPITAHQAGFSSPLVMEVNGVSLVVK